MVPPNMVWRARSGSTWMYWWSPVTSAKAFTRSWVISTHGPTPISSPTSVFSSSTVLTSRGMDHLLRSKLLEPQGQGTLTVEVGLAVERLEVLGALEVQVQVELPGEADAAVDLDRVAADLPRRLADKGLRDRCGERGVLGAGVERPGGVVGRGVGL